MQVVRLALGILFGVACRPNTPHARMFGPTRAGAPVVVRFRAEDAGDEYSVVAEHAAGVSRCRAPCALTLPRGAALLRVSGERRFHQLVDIDRAATWRILNPGRAQRAAGVTGLVVAGLGMTVGAGLLLSHDLSASFACATLDRRCEESGLGLPTIASSLALAALMAVLGLSSEPDRVEVEPDAPPTRMREEAPPSNGVPPLESHPTVRDQNPASERW